MNFSAKNLIRILESKGFVLLETKGSHHIYFNVASNKLTIVPMHGNKDIPKGTFFSILKQAGIDKSEI